MSSPTQPAEIGHYVCPDCVRGVPRTRIPAYSAAARGPDAFAPVPASRSDPPVRLDATRGEL
eukprot:gene10260-17783_t